MQNDFKCRLFHLVLVLEIANDHLAILADFPFTSVATTIKLLLQIL